MANRLITLISKVDKIFKTRLCMIQPRYSNFRQFLSQSRANFSHEIQNRFDKLLHLWRDNNGGAKTIKRMGAAENKKIDKGINSASSTSPPKSAPKAPNQNSKLLDIGGGKEEETFEKTLIAIVFFAVCADLWYARLTYRRNAYQVIKWKVFVNDFLDQDRVTNPKVIEETWLEFQTPPGSLAFGANTYRVRIDKLDSHELVNLLGKLLKITEKERNAEPENHLFRDLYLHFSFGFRLIMDIGRKSYQKFLEIRRKAKGLLISGRLTATIYEWIFRK